MARGGQARPEATPARFSRDLHRLRPVHAARRVRPHQVLRPGLVWPLSGVSEPSSQGTLPLAPRDPRRGDRSLAQEQPTQAGAAPDVLTAGYVPTVVIRPARDSNQGLISAPKAVTPRRTTTAIVAMISPYSTTSCARRRPIANARVPNRNWHIDPAASRGSCNARC